MNSTELSAEFQSALVLAHHIYGSIFFVLNSFICLLIAIDNDFRNKSYRKYLFSLQLFSILADLCLTVYPPIVQFNCRLLYSDSALAKVYNIETALMLYIACFFGVVSTYFSCVYYRRNMLLPPGTYFCFHGWKYTIFLTILQAFMIVIVIAIYYIISTLPAPFEEIPLLIAWVTRKSSFIVISNSRVNYTALIFAILSALFCGITILFMIFQLIHEINHGMDRASTATKRYQKRAVYSLIMQGVVPSIFFAGPAFCMLCLHLFTLVVGADEAAYNRFASTLSVMSINVMSLHGFVHSLTILACSPSYRARISLLIRRTTVIVTRKGQPTSETVQRITTIAAESTRRSVIG